MINKQNIYIEQYSFEKLDNFKYLDVNISANNNIHNEINIRISVANWGYFTMNRIFKSRLLQSKTLHYVSPFYR